MITMIQEEVGWLRPDPWTRLSLSSGHNVDHNCDYDHDHNDYHYCDYIYDHNCDHAHENNHNRLPCNAPKHDDAFSGWDPMDPSEWFTSWKNTNSRLQKVLLLLIRSLFLLGSLVSLFSLLLIKSSSLTSFIRLNRTKGTCRSTSTSLDTKLSTETGKVCCLAYLYFFGPKIC